jgi:hypothetical protein
MYTKYKERWLETQARDNESSEEDEDEDGNPLPKQDKVIPLWKRLNRDGYTPLTLAAKLGQAAMFSFLLEECKITQWSFGPVACVLYPLDQVDLEIHDDVKKINFYFLFLNKNSESILGRRWIG